MGVVLDLLWVRDAHGWKGRHAGQRRGAHLVDLVESGAEVPAQRPGPEDRRQPVAQGSGVHRALGGGDTAVEVGVGGRRAVGAVVDDVERLGPGVEGEAAERPAARALGQHCRRRADDEHDGGDAGDEAAAPSAHAAPPR